MQLSLVLIIRIDDDATCCCLGNPTAEHRGLDKLKELMVHGGPSARDTCVALLMSLLSYLDTVKHVNVDHDGRHLCVSVVCFLPWRI